MDDLTLRAQARAHLVSDLRAATELVASSSRVLHA
jgi:hypothetical protein